MLGHLGQALTGFIPLTFLLLEKIFETPHKKYFIILPFILFFQLLSSSQYSVYLSVAVFLYILTKINTLIKNFEIVKYFVVSILLFLLLSSWYIKGYIGKSRVRSIKENLHPHYRISEFEQVFEFIHYKHILFLSVMGILMIRKSRKIIPYVVIGGASILFMLGPVHPLAPYTFLYNYWPFIKSFRVPMRFSPFVSMSLALILSYFIFKISDKRIAIVFLFIILILTPLGIPKPINELPPYRIENTYLEKIATDDEEYSILNYPIRYNCMYNYYAFILRKPILGGCSSYLPEHFLHFLEGCDIDVSTGKFINLSNIMCLNRLKEYHTKYILYHDTTHPDFLYFESLFGENLELKDIVDHLGIYQIPYD